MGDVTIHLLLDSALLRRGKRDDDDDVVHTNIVDAEDARHDVDVEPTFRFRASSCVLPGDSALSELVGVVLSAIEDDANKTKPTMEEVMFIDSSYHPPRDVTSTVRRLGRMSHGPSCTTLQSMGWYPSGRLVVFPWRPDPDDVNDDDDDDGGGAAGKRRGSLLARFVEWSSRNAHALHEDVEYNYPKGVTRARGEDGKGEGSTTLGEVRWWTGGGEPSSSAADNGRTMSMMKPSDILDAVARRATVAPSGGGTKDKKERTRKRRTERERTRRIDALLRNLDAKSGEGRGEKKKKLVSDKVRTMLLKSRSEGNSKLRMEDRFHLEAVRLCDSHPATPSRGVGGGVDGGAMTSYRFYSRSTTAGRVASSIALNLGNEMSAEFLVRYPPPPPNPGDATHTRHRSRNDAQRYRRLPNTMTLHDAERDGWIREFDSILVRVYPLVAHLDGCDAMAVDDDEYDNLIGPTKTVLEPDSDDDEITGEYDGGADMETGEDGGHLDDDTRDSFVAAVVMDADDRNTNQRVEHPGEKTLQRRRLFEQRIHAIFQSLDENANCGGAFGEKKKTMMTTTKKKPVSKQVQNMMIKSKSTGNARLKQEDRVYVQVVLLRDNDDYDTTTTDTPSSPSCSASYRYFSKRDDLWRIITTVLDGDPSIKLCDKDDIDATGFEFIVPRKDSSDSMYCSDDNASYRVLPTTLALGDAVDKGFIENFGAIIVCACCNIDNR